MPNRYLCDVLQEVRKMHKTRNYSSLLAAIEEAQSMGNRMEAALGDKADVKRYGEEASKLKKELKELRSKLANYKKLVERKNKLVELIKKYRATLNKETKGDTLIPVEYNLDELKCQECGMDCLKCNCKVYN